MNDRECLKSDVCLVCDNSLPCKSLLQASCQVCGKIKALPQAPSMSQMVHGGYKGLLESVDDGKFGPVHFMVAIPIKGTADFDSLKSFDGPKCEESAVRKGFRLSVDCEILDYFRIFHAPLNKRLQLLFHDGFNTNEWKDYCDLDSTFEFNHKYQRIGMPIDLTNCDDLQMCLISGTGFYPLATALMSMQPASITAKATGVNTKDGDSCSYAICDMLLVFDERIIASGRVMPVKISWTKDLVTLKWGTTRKLQKVLSLPVEKSRSNNPSVKTKRRPRGLTR